MECLEWKLSILKNIRIVICIQGVKILGHIVVHVFQRTIYTDY